MTDVTLEQTKLDLDDLNDLNNKQDVGALTEAGGVEGIAKGIGSDLNNGLSKDEEATDFVERKRKYGQNVTPDPPFKNIFQLFIEALKDATIIILIIAAVISLILGLTLHGEEGPKTGWIEGTAILIAVLIVACVTAGNNYSKEKQFRKLNAVKNNRRVKVLRAGEIKEISIFDILVGDIVSLDTGDQVPADGLFISGHELKIDESAMTGEPDAIRKNDKAPFMLSGCQVSEGVGKMLVTGVGVNSKWGRTLASLSEEQPDTPLQEKLDGMAKTIGKFGLAVAILVFVALTLTWGIKLGIEKTPWRWSELQNLVDFFIIAVTIVVVAVPEGLPLAVTISLAYSVRQMMADNNLVRQLSACETMGGATNICSDKTGTLTENRMSVRQGWVSGFEFDKDKALELNLESNAQAILAEGIAVNSTAEVITSPGKPHEYIGNKTECALLVFVADYIDYREARKKNDAFKLYPFSSARKRMSIIIKKDHGFRLYTKGASEIVFGLCTSYLNEKGQVVPIPDDLRKRLNHKIDTMAELALRTICLAYRDFDQEQEWQNPPEENLICVGIVGIRDPLRKEVPDAVAACQRAGIFVRMVTGDNIKTAKRIAQDCGILSPEGIAMEGPEFNSLTDEQIDEILPRLQVLARSAPEHKLKLVKRLMANGEVVSVTGDGTNDAPALKAADVGLSMGISGTEVAKEASKIVILDDNFNSIKQSVLWGRCVYDNIRKFLQFQLTVNVVALIVAFVGALSGRGTPLKAVQLLWVNLIMDTMAALALGTEKPTPALLYRKPYGRDTPLISPVMWRNIAGQSLFQLFLLFIILYSGHLIWDVGEEGSVEHYTILFNTFVLSQIFNEINSRKVNDEFNVFEKIHTNTIFLAILGITIVLQFIIVQFAGHFAATAPLTVGQWFSCIGIAFISLPAGMVIRMIPVPKTAADLKPNPNDIFSERSKLTTGEEVTIRSDDQVSLDNEDYVFKKE